MNKFKTVSPSNPARRVFSDGLLKVNSVDENKNYKVSLMLISEGRNRNGWVYEGLANNLEQFVNIPLLYSVIDGKVANSHDFEIKKDKSGETYASFIGAESEHIAGWISDKLPNGEFNAYIANIDGKQWVCIKEAFLPAYYNKEFIDELENNGGQMSISIETLVYKNRIVGDTEYEETWKCVGVTILGRDVAPAVAGANIRKLSAYGEELKELKLKVASYYEQETQIKEPQTRKNQNSKKGETRTMAKKTMHIEDLRSKFNGYTVLGVNGLNVALLNQSNGRCCFYPFGENEDTVLPERIEEVAVNCSFGEGDNMIDVPIEQIIGSVQAQLNSTKTALDKATADNAELTAKINEMTEAERKRRKKVVEKAIKSRLDDNRKDYDNIDEHLCDDMLADDCIGKYAEMEKDGEFCGDTAAQTEVDARCMRKLKEASKARAEQRKNSMFSFEKLINGEGGEGSPADGVKNSVDKILED